MHAIVVAPHETTERTDVLSICDRVNESDARALTVARHRVVDAEFAKKGFRRDTECCASRDHLCFWSGFAQRSQNNSRFGRVMPKRDRVAVVYVANRDADDRRCKLTRSFGRCSKGVALEAEIDKSHFVSCRVERRRDAREPIGHNRVWLPLAVRTDQQNPRTISLMSVRHEYLGE